MNINNYLFEMVVKSILEKFKYISLKNTMNRCKIEQSILLKGNYGHTLVKQ